MTSQEYSRKDGSTSIRVPAMYGRMPVTQLDAPKVIDPMPNFNPICQLRLLGSNLFRASLSDSS
jgi:hypothetical protein